MQFLARTIYFLLFGWWMSFIWILIAYFLCVIIIGLPIGLLMLNRLPQVMTLRPVERYDVQIERRQEADGGSTSVRHEMVRQEHPMILRILYFIFIGSWLGFPAAVVGWIFCLTIVFIPLGLIIFNHFPAILTLKRVY